jgi:DNA-binding ferritin-like protein (Dps family)
LNLISLGSGVVAISFGEMDSVKSNLKKARDKSDTVKRSINNAKLKLQADKGSSRIRAAEDELENYYRRITRTQQNLNDMVTKIGKIEQKFKDVDKQCAERIRAIGVVEKSKRSFLGDISGFFSIGEKIQSKVSSIVQEGKNIFDSLINDGERLNSFINKEKRNIYKGINGVINSGKLGETIGDTGVLIGIGGLAAISSNQNFLKKAPKSEVKSDFGAFDFTFVLLFQIQ